MALLSIKASKKIDTVIKLEESTARLVDRYAHFVKASPDDVVNQALEYIFTKDKDFQQHLEQNPNAQVPSALRVKKPALTASAAKNGSRNGTSHEAVAAK